MWKLPSKITVWGNVGPKVHQIRFFGKKKNFYASEDNYRDSELGNIVKQGSKITRKLKEFPPKKDLEKGFQPNKSKAFVPDDTLKERLSFAPEEEIDETEYFNYEEDTTQVGGTRVNAREPKLVIPEQRSPKINYTGDSWNTRARGSRKRAVAVSLLKPGSGIITVNNLPLLHYFPALDSRENILLPFLVTEMLGKFDLDAKVSGGGKSAQAVAVRMATSRALQEYDPDLRPVLKKAGYLTRDQREVERKKPGQPKARKKFQWSKR